MSADLTHGGVTRVAGVVHVGTPTKRAGLYVADGRSYKRSASHTEAWMLVQLQKAVREAQECAARSWVAAVAALMEWVNGGEL